MHVLIAPDKFKGSVADYLKEHIAKLGENIVVRRFSRLALGEVA